jgi:uncharacterized protein (TIGR03435 family)
MRKLICWVIALAAFMGCALYAQQLPGTWQGTLKAGERELRIVMKLSLDDDKLKAVMYSIDQGGDPITANTFTHKGSSVKFSITQIGGSYEGTLSSDGNTINGTWTQGQPMPLNLVRATADTAWTIPEPPPPPKVMAEDAKPEFEVATIKPARPEERFSLLVNRSGMMNTTATSLSDLIKFAYDLHPRQITGGPSWLETERFDVSGKPDTPGLPNVKQLKAMVQKLLADRFALKFHLEQKELPVFAIQLASTGHKMTKNDSNPKGLPGFGGGGPRGMFVRNATMAEFAHVMQANVLDKPVVDQTGLGTARWDFILKWTPDGPRPGAGAAAQPGGAPTPAPAGNDVDAPPDIFAAFQQQLGLKLQSTKASVDVLVIDKVDKPSAN